MKRYLQNRYYIYLIIIFSFLLSENLFGQGPTYCTPVFTSGTSVGDYIDGFQIINASGNILVSNLNTGSKGGPSYTFYSSMDGYLTIPETYQLKIYSGDYPNYYTIWIDYNNDGDFYDTGEKIGTKYISNNSSGIIPLTLTSSSPIGLFRLRIRCTYNISSFDPCTSLAYGEAEDYEVNIKQLLTAQSTTGLPDLYLNSSTEFGDYDNDGDYDLCISGINSASSNITLLYRNNGGYSFTPINIGMLQVSSGTCSWCDYNNDGWLDIFLTGENGTNKISVLYRNNGNLTFTPITPNIPGYYVASHDWGDYNLDGKQDVLISGVTDYLGDEITETALYENYDNGIFFKVNVDLLGLAGGKAKFVDFNNDNYLDISLTGMDNNNNFFTKLYLQQTDQSFIDYPVNIIGLLLSNFEWGDYNNDGYYDHLISGDKNNIYKTYIYRNNQNLNFTQTNELPGSGVASVAWRDFNNDGLLDFFTGGTSQYTYLQSNADAFSLNESYYPDRIGLYLQAPVLDINSDNKPDFLLSGQLVSTNTIYRNYFYINRSTITNATPTIPSNLTVSNRGNYTRLSWSQSADDHTPAGRISYNVRLRNTSDNKEVIMPLANLSSGKLKSKNRGNAGVNEEILLKNLPTNKNYSFQVQAIDDNNAASAFSPTSNFTNSSLFTLKSYEVSTNPVGARFCDLDNNGIYDVVALNGFNPGTIYSEIYSSEYYNNPIGTFTKVNKGINITKGKIVLGDYDNDNTVEYLLLGHYHEQDFSTGEILEYFPYMNPVIQKALMNGDGDFGDYDNDGDLDLIVIGNDINNIYYTSIYNNENGILSLTTTSLPGRSYGTVKWIDYDNDMDLDIFISGSDPSGNFISELYNNTGGSFINSNIIFTGFINSEADWADYNNDGYLDLVISGNDEVNLNQFIQIYKNNGNNLFQKTCEIGDYGKVQWGDYDNDGLSDLLANGKVYMNMGNDNFEKVDGNYVGDYWGDYDNDGILDIIRGTIYVNNYNSIQNTAPSAPSGQTVAQDGNSITLEWNAATDNESTAGGLSYNIRLGTGPGKFDIISPCSNIGTGKLRYPNRGNTGFSCKRLINGLEPGIYYWSVQAVDQGFMGGAWSQEANFTVKVIQADFSSNIVCEGTPTHFSDLTYIYGQTIDSWKWSYNNQQFSDIQNPSYVFSVAGTYLVKLEVTTSGFTDSITKSVEIKANPINNFNVDVACIGSPNFIDNITDPNGLSVTQWFWDFGDNQNSLLEEPLSHSYSNTGEYDISLITLADNGCTDTISKETSVYEYPIAEVSTDAPLTFCSNDSVTLSVPYKVNYSYNWKLDGISLTDADSSKNVAKYTGNYSVVVVNTKGNCITTSNSFAVNALPVPSAPLIFATGPLEFCQSDSVLLSVTNTPGYNYQWKLNGWDVGSNSNQLTAKDAGNYSLTVSNLSGCATNSINTVSVVVNPVPALPTVNLSGLTTFCQGGNVEFSVTSNTDYTYQWENAGANITGAVTSTYVAHTQGIYSLKIANSKGCITRTQDMPVDVLESPAPPAISSEGPTEFCQGDSIQLSVTNTAGYSYQWKLNGGAVGINSNLHSAKSEGVYSLVISNSSGCSVNSTNNINVIVDSKPNLPTVNIGGLTTFCQGGSVELNVTNTSGYTYQWENNGSGISGAETSTFIASSPGVYSLKISNSSGCYIKTENVTVNVLTVPSAPEILASKPPVLCQGDSVRLSVTNTTGYSYQWKLNGGAVGSNISEYHAKNSGSYNLVVANSSGCSVTATVPVDVTVYPLPTGGTIVPGSTTTFCKGGSVILNVTPNAGYTYSWKNEAGPLNVTSSSYTATESGNYRVDITNSYGCVLKSTEETVTVKPFPVTPVISAENYTNGQCPYDYKVKLSTGEGTGYKYQWLRNGTVYPNGTLSYIQDNLPLSEYLPQGDYSVETDLDGCKIESEIININYAIAPEKPEILVKGPVVWYMATSRNTYKNYRWYLNDELIAGANKYIYVANKKLGTYRVEVANENPCYTSSDKKTIPTAKSDMTDFNIPAEYLVGEETDVFGKLKIYPNPTPGRFTIEMDNNVLGELDISIITQSGKEILNIKFDKTTEHFSSQIDLSGQSKGIYFINLAIQEYFATRKLLVE